MRSQGKDCKRGEQQIKESLKREDLLSREINHRVKNNLQRDFAHLNSHWFKIGGRKGNLRVVARLPRRKFDKDVRGWQFGSGLPNAG